MNGPGAYVVGLAVVIAIAVLVALVFTKNRYAGVGCILAIFIMSCGLLGEVMFVLAHPK